MDSGKNKAPKGVIIAFGLIILMIVVYLILTFAFPGVFDSLESGELSPTD